jgi:hypothetical protein
MYVCILPDTLVYPAPPLKCVFQYTTLQFWYNRLLTSNSRYSALIDYVPRQTCNIPCLLQFISVVSRVTLDLLNVETSVRFYLVLSVFTYGAVGSLGYSKSPLTDTRTVTAVFVVALILLKPTASLVLLEYSASAHCWLSHLVFQVCHDTAMEMCWPVWLMYWCRLLCWGLLFIGLRQVVINWKFRRLCESIFS